MWGAVLFLAFVHVIVKLFFFFFLFFYNLVIWSSFDSYEETLMPLLDVRNSFWLIDYSKWLIFHLKQSMLFVSLWSFDDLTIPKPNLSCKFWYVLRTMQSLEAWFIFSTAIIQKCCNLLTFSPQSQATYWFLQLLPVRLYESWVCCLKNFCYFLLLYLLEVCLMETILTTK